ncbi:MAG TPA: hypothetical protein VGP72_25360 [Planctomycetota bacterium]|jgi:hypothetical protein
MDAATVQTPSAKFAVIPVQDGALDREHTGTTLKFWLPGGRMLFKAAREGTGEYWSEKLASELAALMGLPAARVDLACWGDTPGVISHSFLMPGEYFLQQKRFRRVIARLLPPEQRSGLRYHTLSSAKTLLSFVELPPRWNPPAEVTCSLDAFAGYLLFDAWVNNEDRHHENWGVIATRAGVSARRYHLAPTFDHASSLGRELDDPQRASLLQNGEVPDYVLRCPSGICTASKSRHPMTTHEVVRETLDMFPAATHAWAERLFSLSEESVRTVIEQVPEGMMSETSRQFALAVLSTNKLYLQHLVESRLP